MRVHFFIKQLIDKKNHYFERQNLKKGNSGREILEKRRQFERLLPIILTCNLEPYGTI